MISSIAVLPSFFGIQQNGYLWGLWEGDRSYPNGENYIEDYINLNDKELPVIVEAPGLGSKAYEFTRIMSAENFKKNVADSGADSIAEDLENLSEDCWVFSYFESELVLSDSGAAGGMPGALYTYYGTEAEGYILQIEFMDISGNVYDLGVVSDGFKSTGTSAENGGTDILAHRLGK